MSVLPLKAELIDGIVPAEDHSVSATVLIIYGNEIPSNVDFHISEGGKTWPPDDGVITLAECCWSATPMLKKLDYDRWGGGRRCVARVYCRLLDLLDASVIEHEQWGTSALRQRWVADECRSETQAS